MVMWTDQWGPHISEKEKKIRYRFGHLLPGPWAVAPSGPKGFPGPFYIFFYFSSPFLFLFSVSYFLHILFKIGPI
jgi:hypothetical protein